MATAEDLDAEVAAAILAQTTLTQRMISDYDDQTGEQIPHGEERFRLRVDYIERTVLNSNDFEWSCAVDVDGFAAMDSPVEERDSYVASLRASQRILTDPQFWRALPSVFEVNGTTTPQVVTAIERTGRVLSYTMSVQIILSPA